MAQRERQFVGVPRRAVRDDEVGHDEIGREIGGRIPQPEVGPLRGRRQQRRIG